MTISPGRKLTSGGQLASLTPQQRRALLPADSTFGRVGLTLEQMFGPRNVSGITEIKLTPGELNRLDGTRVEYTWYDEIPTYIQGAEVAIANTETIRAMDEPVPFTKADKDVLKALTDEYIAVHSLATKASLAAKDATVGIQGLASAGKQQAQEVAQLNKTVDLLRKAVDAQSETIKAQERRLAELSEFVGRALEENSAALMRALDRVDLIDSELALAQREKATKAPRGRKAA
jgi:hypothetical protein